LQLIGFQFGFHEWPVRCISHKILNTPLERAEETTILKRKLNKPDNSETRKKSFIGAISGISVKVKKTFVKES